MPTRSVTLAKSALRKPKQERVGKGPSFGEWARRVAGMVKGAPRDLSTRLDRKAEPNETTAAAIRESVEGLPNYRSTKGAWRELKLKRTARPFGPAARKYAGIVRSGIGDLSTREGFGD